MPIFEYQCEECGNEFQELVMSKAQEAAIVCSGCSSSKVIKLLSGGTVRSTAGATASGSTPRPSGGCGSGCGCH